MLQPVRLTCRMLTCQLSGLPGWASPFLPVHNFWFLDIKRKGKHFRASKAGENDLSGCDLFILDLKIILIFYLCA